MAESTSQPAHFDDAPRGPSTPASGGPRHRWIWVVVVVLVVAAGGYFLFIDFNQVGKQFRQCAIKINF